MDNIVLQTEWFDETEKFCEVRLSCETKFLQFINYATSLKMI